MSRRGLLIALIVSMAVNLFVLGGLAGAVLTGAKFRGPPPEPGPPRLVVLGAALTPAQRDAWQVAIRQAAEHGRPKLQQARALRNEAWQALAADPVNPSQALGALDQARTLEFQARSDMDRAVVAFAATLPADERQKLGEALRRARRGPPPGGWLGRRPGPGGEPPLPDR